MQIYSADDTMEGGAETVEEILQTGFQPDAIIASSDLAAMGSIKVLIDIRIGAFPRMLPWLAWKTMVWDCFRSRN